MKATDIQEPRRADKQIDFDNYCKLIRAVQELLSAKYDGRYFEIQGASAKSITLKREAEIPKPFTITWDKTTGKKITIGAGYARLHAYTASLLIFSHEIYVDEATLTFPDKTSAYDTTVYAAVKVSKSSGIQLVNFGQAQLVPSDYSLEASPPHTGEGWFHYALADFHTDGNGSDGSKATYYCTQLRWNSDLHVWAHDDRTSV